MLNEITSQSSSLDDVPEVNTLDGTTSLPAYRKGSTELVKVPIPLISKAAVDASTTAVSTANAARDTANSAVAAVESISESIGVPEGIASLDANGKLLEDQLPSSSREVIKFSGDLVGNITFEPAVGDTGTLYYYPAHGTLILRGNNGKYYSDWVNGDFCGTSSANGRVPVIGKIYIDAVNNI